MHADGEQSAVGVGQDVALAAGLFTGDTILPDPGSGNPSGSNFRRLGFRIVWETVAYRRPAA